MSHKLIYLFVLSLVPLMGITNLVPNEPQIRTHDYALLFAVNDYKNPPLRDLQNPIQNARDIADLLEKDFGFSTEVIENPTAQQMESKLYAYKEMFAKQNFPPDAQLFIYFSGHGEEEFSEGYFLPADANSRRLRQTALPYTFLRDLINSIDCQHILVAIDACYSVNFDENWANRPGLFSRPGELSEGEKLLQKHASTKSRLFFTSDGQGDQTPDKSGFAKKLQEGLMGPAGVDNILTSTNVFTAMEIAVPTPHRGEFGDDAPGSSFLFVRQYNLDPLKSDLETWQAAQANPSIQSFQNYLQRFPNGDFASIARSELQKLQAEENLRRDLSAWQRAKDRGTAAAYQAYLDEFPNGSFALPAREFLKTPTDNNHSVSSNPKDLPGPPMSYVEGGTFQMGCTSEQKDCGSDETAHSATISSFYMGQYEVTFEEFDEFCTATQREKPSDSKWGRNKRPVINVDWYDAIEYCNWLSSKIGYTPVYTIDKSSTDPNNSSSSDKKKWTVIANWQANGFRLPTEAEWEYAARQKGQKVLFGNGKNVLDPAEVNFDASSSYKKSYSIAGNYRGKTVPVGSLNRPNSLDLHDMSGNVWEWCWDWKGDYLTNSPKDYKGPKSGAYRVGRGGSWSHYPQYCRVANRSRDTPGFRSRSLGFRLARNG